MKDGKPYGYIEKWEELSAVLEEERTTPEEDPE